MAASYQVAPPEQFVFSRPHEWPKWIRRFERFRSASGLCEKSKEVQVNTLIYSMGDEADDILKSFGLTDVQKKEYETVKDKFESHFIKKRNVIYERAKFNMRKQEDNEPVDAFITDLYVLAEHCSYGALHDEMIRDRLVVGLRNARLSEKLQLDADLTLEMAMVEVRQSEVVKQQQTVIRSKEDFLPIGSVKSAGNPHRKSCVSPAKFKCSWCGKSPSHDRAKCPARDAACRKCQKKGHFAVVCRSTKAVRTVQQQEEDNDETFLGAVGDSSWRVALKVND